MMDKRLEKIENYIRKYHMIEKGDRIVIGVSGGADSVCLLMALCSLQEKLGFQVLVCHVNHELCEDRHLNNSVKNRAGQRLQQRIIVMTMQKQCFLTWQEEPGFADCVG